MFGILVADDGEIMLESIKNIILSNFGGEREVMCVKTGRAVIEQAEAFRPDIAFVNIQMSELSGIQAIRGVCRFSSSMVFIIMTAYDKFSYAQEAVNLGVIEFIAKPVNKKKILEVSIQAMRQVEKTRQKLSGDLKIREKLELVVPMIKSDFIYNLLQGDTDIYRSGYLNMLDIRKQYGFMVVPEFGNSMVDELMTSAVGASVRVNKHCNQLRKLVRDCSDCIIGPIVGDRIVLLAPFGGEKTRYEERVEIITRVRNMIHKLGDVIDIRFRGGIGAVKPVRDTRDSYKEALRALRESDSHAVHIMGISVVADYDGEYPLELGVQYFQRRVKADREGVAGCTNEFFDWMVAHAGNVGTNAGVKVLELVMHLEQKVWEIGCIQYRFHYRGSYLNEIQGAGGMNTLRHWFIGGTGEVCENISTFRGQENESVASRVKGYINEGFAKDISLDDMSRLMDISPYYFSKLFKQEVGENFIEHLTHIRVGHAKQLLGDPRYSIKGVRVMCGYNDPNYFSRIFEKYKGKTPGEYKER